jgi:ribonuclease HI
MAGNIIHETNNSTELWGLTNDLHKSISLGFNSLIIEGDSQIILNLLSKILNGADPSQISPCWHLTSDLQTLKSFIQLHTSIVPSHVHRKANQITDKLANIGVTQTLTDLDCDPITQPDHPILKECIDHATNSDLPPDGVSSTHKLGGEERHGLPRLTH